MEAKRLRQIEQRSSAALTFEFFLLHMLLLLLLEGSVMPTVSENIPETLQPRVEAAVAWFNASPEAAGDAFKATGILDEAEALAGSEELRLVLCGGDRCEQHSFRLSGTADAWQVELATAFPAIADGKPQAELDPPPGARRNWLDQTLAQHAFVVLLFYRGFW